jgi:alpha-N-arabinofuranosidase
MSTYMSWDRTVVEETWDTADYLSAHRYSLNNKNDTPWFLAEGVEIERIVTDYRGLLDYVRGYRKNDKRMYLSFDEWNVWYRERGHDGGWKEAPHLLEEPYNLEDALVCAQYLNSFIRNADVVKMACIAQIVNVIAPIMTKKDGLLVQSIFHPIELMAENATGKTPPLSLRPVLASPNYNAGERGECPVIDVSVSYDPSNGQAAFFLVNRKIDDSATVSIRFSDRTISKVIGGEALGGQEPKVLNTWEKPDAVKRFKADAKVLPDGGAEVQLKSCGFAAVRVETKGR